MLNHVRNTAVWLSLAAFGAGAAAVLPTPVAAEETPLRKITKKVMPIYSLIAKKARLTGTVKMLALVSPNGTVKSVQILGGNPLFVAAAEDAVKQWKFEVAPKETTEPVALKFENPT
jgi:TonB family protein